VGPERGTNHRGPLLPGKHRRMDGFLIWPARGCACSRCAARVFIPAFVGLPEALIDSRSPPALGASGPPCRRWGGSLACAARKCRAALA